MILFTGANDLDEQGAREAPFYETYKASFDYGFGEQVERAIKGTRLYRLFYIAENHYKYHRLLLKFDDPDLKTIYRDRPTDTASILKLTEFLASDAEVKPYSPDLRNAWGDYFETLDRLNQKLSTQGIDFLFVISPGPLDVFRPHPQDLASLLEDGLNQRKIPYISLTDEFLNYPGDPRELYHAPPVDFHLSRKGNLLLTEKLLAQTLSNLQ